MRPLIHYIADGKLFTVECEEGVTPELMIDALHDHDEFDKHTQRVYVTESVDDNDRLTTYEWVAP